MKRHQNDKIGVGFLAMLSNSSSSTS